MNQSLVDIPSQTHPYSIWDALEEFEELWEENESFSSAPLDRSPSIG